MKYFRNRIKDDSGLMGPSHSLVGIALYLLFTALLPEIVFDKLLGTRDVYVYVVSVLVIAGSVLFPDVDNVKSTVISTLGIVGTMLSKLMRSFAVVVFYITRSKYDSDTPDPHRGFWHTFASAGLFGFITYITSNLSFEVTIPYLNKTYPLGMLIGIGWILICIRLAIAGLHSSFNRKLKGADILTKMVISALAIGLSVSVLLRVPEATAPTWIAYLVGIGYALHLVGDLLTVSGVPILWPIPTKGKRWWNHRLLAMKAGGAIEFGIIMPVSAVIIVYSTFKIIGFLTGGSA